MEKEFSQIGQTKSATTPAPGVKPPPYVAPLLVQHHTRHFRYGKQLTIIGTICVLATTVIGVGWQVYSQGTLAHVQMAQMPVTPDQANTELAKMLDQKVAGYRFDIQRPSAPTKQHKLSDAGITIDSLASVAEAKKRKKFGSIVSKLQWWHTESSPLTYKIDSNRLATFIKTEATHIIEPATNAALSIGSAGSVTLADSKTGQSYSEPNTKTILSTAASHLEPTSIVLTKRAQEPNISNKAVLELKQKVDAALQQTVQLTIDGRVFTAKTTDIAGWIDLPDFNKAERLSFEINSGNIEKYIDDIADPYVADGRAQIEMTNSSGEKIVLVKGRNGYGVKEKPKLASDIAKQLTAGQSISQTVELSTADFKTIDAREYDKWLVVDLTNKHMEAYERDKLIRSFQVSAGAPQTPTVLGQYKIKYKVRRQDMRGLNVDGSSYFQPNVEWVNYFYEGYAIHGNYWRPATWFGNVNSSHGCVGVMNVDAKWIYEWAPVGTPIITHL